MRGTAAISPFYAKYIISLQFFQINNPVSYISGSLYDNIVRYILCGLSSESIISLWKLYLRPHFIGGFAKGSVSSDEIVVC